MLNIFSDNKGEFQRSQDLLIMGTSGKSLTSSDISDCESDIDIVGDSNKVFGAYSYKGA